MILKYVLELNCKTDALKNIITSQQMDTEYGMMKELIQEQSGMKLLHLMLKNADCL